MKCCAELSASNLLVISCTLSFWLTTGVNPLLACAMRSSAAEDGHVPQTGYCPTLGPPDPELAPPGVACTPTGMLPAGEGLAARLSSSSSSTASFSDVERSLSVGDRIPELFMKCWTFPMSMNDPSVFTDCCDSGTPSVCVGVGFFTPNSGESCSCNILTN